MFACGLIAGRFMSFFLELVGRLGLHAAAENGMSVPVAELRTAVRDRGAQQPPRRAPRASPSTQRSTASAQQPPRTETGRNLSGTKPHRTFLPTNPPNTSGHKATFQGKATNELAINPLGELGALRIVPAHHARVSETSLRGVGALLHACPVSFILPPL